MPCRDGVWLENKKTLAAVRVVQQGHAVGSERTSLQNFHLRTSIWLIKLILANGSDARDKLCDLCPVAVGKRRFNAFMKKWMMVMGMVVDVKLKIYDDDDDDDNE